MLQIWILDIEKYVKTKRCQYMEKVASKNRSCSKIKIAEEWFWYMWFGDEVSCVKTWDSWIGFRAYLKTPSNSWFVRFNIFSAYRNKISDYSQNNLIQWWERNTKNITSNKMAPNLTM